MNAYGEVEEEDFCAEETCGEAEDRLPGVLGLDFQLTASYPARRPHYQPAPRLVRRFVQLLFQNSASQSAVQPVNQYINYYIGEQAEWQTGVRARQELDYELQNASGQSDYPRDSDPLDPLEPIQTIQAARPASARGAFHAANTSDSLIAAQPDDFPTDLPYFYGNNLQQLAPQQPDLRYSAYQCVADPYECYEGQEDAEHQESEENGENEQNGLLYAEYQRIQGQTTDQQFQSYQPLQDLYYRYYQQNLRSAGPPAQVYGRAALPSKLSAPLLDSAFDLVQFVRGSRVVSEVFRFYAYYQYIYNFAQFARQNLSFPVLSLRGFILSFLTAHARPLLQAYNACAELSALLSAFLASFLVIIPRPNLCRIYRRSLLGIFPPLCHAALETAEVRRILYNNRFQLLQKLVLLAAPLLFYTLLAGPFRGEIEEESRVFSIFLFFIALYKYPAIFSCILFVAELVDATVDFQGGARGGFYLYLLDALFSGFFGRVVQRTYAGNF